VCFLWGTNWIYICYVEESRPPLWSSGQSSRLQIQKSGFDSRRSHIFWEVVGQESSPLSLVSTIEELLWRKSSGFGLENRVYGRRRSAKLTTRHLSIRKFGSNFANKRRSLGLYSFRSSTQAMELVFLLFSIRVGSGARQLISAPKSIKKHNYYYDYHRHICHVWIAFT
jgi:hypothetical protein